MEWFTCRRRILRGRYSTSSHSASDAAIAFPRGATPCAKSIPTLAGLKGAQPHPPSDPAPHSRTKAARGFPCTHVRTPEPPEARPKKATPTDKERKAPKIPQVSFRTHVADRGLARWQSIIPRTQKPAKTRARWQSIASMRSHAPRPPTEPRQGCERTAQLNPRIPTSTTQERKRVCRWEARAGPPAGQSDAQVGTKAHAQGGEAAATSNPRAVLAAELDLSSKETEKIRILFLIYQEKNLCVREIF